MSKKNRNANRSYEAARKATILIDAYNVIHADGLLKEALNHSLELARNRLRDMCRYYSQRKPDTTIILIFDGDSSVGQVPEQSREKILSQRKGIREIFTQTGVKADNRILVEVNQRSGQTDLVVVTADVDVIQESRVAGAYVLAPDEFILQSRPKPLKPKPKVKANQRKTSGSLNEKRINHKQKEDLLSEFEALFGEELDKPL